MELMDQLWAWWSNTKIKAEYEAQIKKAADMIEKHWVDYQAVASRTNVPAHVIGVIHFRESSFNFQTHLANGDPLFNNANEAIATSHVPSGLGPFHNWREGAVGALMHQGFDKGYHWDICNALDNLERYNGLGYRRRDIASPYVWSGSEAYDKGMYVADGNFDPDKVDPRPGCAPILWELRSRGYDMIERTPFQTVSKSGELL